MPQQYDQVADLTGEAKLSAFLNAISSSVAKTMMQLPEQLSYMEQCCCAST
jgi:hypothetical protein